MRVAASTTVRLPDASGRYHVVYIVQELIPEDSVCHMATYRMSPADVSRLVMAILNETAKVFDLNRMRGGDMEIGFDGDLSNWAIMGYDPDRGGLPDRFRLTFLDTNTPLMRRHGQEQLDAEPFLRAAPRAILPLIRRDRAARPHVPVLRFPPDRDRAGRAVLRTRRGPSWCRG